MRTWYVTGSHRAVQHSERGVREVPYGEQHAKRLGDLRSPCGLPTLNWPVFWLLDPTSSSMCPECRVVVMNDERKRTLGKGKAAETAPELERTHCGEA